MESMFSAAVLREFIVPYNDSHPPWEAVNQNADNAS